MERIDYQNELNLNIKQWLESIEYLESEYVGLEFEINLCLINLYFSGYVKISLY
jgi:hypothetical protein